jgi:tRNA (guanosine-2'-O-)-methyltransferase
MDQALEFKRSRLVWSDQMQVGELTILPQKVIELLGEHLTDERKIRLQEVVAGRSLQLVSLLENIYDQGNVSAVMRSSEAFGFLGVSLIDAPGARFKNFSTPAPAVRELKEQGYQVWATDLETQDSIDTIDWSRPTAIVLGNEKDGVSEEMRGLVDGRFRIPMLGFSQSFNISVAAALIFYRAHLEHRKLGGRVGLSEAQRQQVLANYYLRCFDNPERLLRAKI